MPRLVPAVVPAGRMRDTLQPTMPAPGGLTLRPWLASDAAILVTAYRDPAIQQWQTLPAARGSGVAAGAVIGLSRWAFGDFGLHRLHLAHSVANPPSCRVAAKAGFRLEGTMHSALLHADGWHDMHLHARARPGPPPQRP